MNHVFERLKEIGKNQSWLAQETGLSQGHVSDLVNNKVQHPNIQTAYKITKALGPLSDFDYLWGYEEGGNQKKKGKELVKKNR